MFEEYCKEAVERAEEGEFYLSTISLGLMRFRYDSLIEEDFPKHYHNAIKSMRERIIGLENKLLDMGADVGDIWENIGDMDRYLRLGIKY